MEKVRRLIFLMTLCIGCHTAAYAQSTFTQKLQQSNQGEGKVVVKQSKEIDELVNGTTINQASTPTVNRQDRVEKEVSRILSETNDTTETSDTADSHKKIMKGQKVSGYRVQVFAGGNSREDRLKAERIGNEIKSLFPGVPVYVHFYSPRWICRMGNYRTYEEAHDVLNRVKNNGYQSAIIVKGRITVQYP